MVPPLSAAGLGRRKDTGVGVCVCGYPVIIFINICSTFILMKHSHFGATLLPFALSSLFLSSFFYL